MAQNLNTSLIINGFSSDTQSLAVKTGNTNIFAVNYNGKIGIGTSSPRARFDINDSGQSLIVGPNASTGSGYKYILESEDNNGLLLGYNTVSGNDNRYQFDVFTNGSRFYIYDNNLTSGNHIKLDTRGAGNHTYFKLTGSTNFGINTTSPSVKLHVKGNSGFYIESDDAGYGSFKFTPYSTLQNYSSIQSADGDELRWGGALGSPLSNGEFAFYNTSNTNVKLAINHLNPNASLHVVGNRSDSATNTLYIQNSGNTAAWIFRDDGIINQGPTIPTPSYPDANVRNIWNSAGWSIGGMYFGSDISNHTSNIPNGYILMGQNTAIGFYADYGGPGEYNYGGIIYANYTTGLLSVRGGVGGLNILGGQSATLGIDVGIQGHVGILSNADATYGFKVKGTGGAGELAYFETYSGNTAMALKNNGNIGIGTASPSDKLHISNGTLRINDTGSTYGAGKLAVSDANGSISFSSTTALGLVTSAGTVNKYSTTLTTPTAGATNTITHNLGTTDITVTLWLVTTGDMTSARITNRQTNSVDVIFAAAPGENVRVVVTG